MDEFDCAIFGIVMIIVILLGFGCLVDMLSCESKTIDFYAHDWGPIKGCMLKPEKDSKWIPLENYRTLN